MDSHSLQAAIDKAKAEVEEDDTSATAVIYMLLMTLVQHEADKERVAERANNKEILG